MEQKNKKKLFLNKETIRDLSHSQLRGAVGGLADNLSRLADIECNYTAGAPCAPSQAGDSCNCNESQVPTNCRTCGWFECFTQTCYVSACFDPRTITCECPPPG